MGGDYEVGYRKPPKATRFKKGKSGNPTGKKKKSVEQDVKKLMYRELKRQVTITENGRRQRISAVELMVRGVLRRAVTTGCPRSLIALMEMIERYEPKPWEKEHEPLVRTEEDKRFERYLLDNVPYEPKAEDDEVPLPCDDASDTTQEKPKPPH